MFLGHLPALDLIEPGIRDRDLERELGHPDGEASEARVRAVLDEDRGVARATDLRAVHVHAAAGGRDLLRCTSKAWLLTMICDCW